MLDILFDALNTWTALGNLKQVPLTGGSAQQWANSSYSIIFGDSTNWILGFGRQTNILGPDIKLIMDWTELLGTTLSNKPGNWNKFRSVVMGQGGSSDMILGGKNLLNYGKMDTTFSRKTIESVKRELANKGDTKHWPFESIRLCIGLGAFVLIGLNVLARTVYMSQALSADPATRTLMQATFQFASKTLEPRLIGLLTTYELSLWIVEQGKKMPEKTANLSKEVSVTVKDITTATTNLTQAELVNNQSVQLINPLIEDKKKLLIGIKDQTEQMASEAATLLLQALQIASKKAVAESSALMSARLSQLDTSNANCIIERDSYRLTTQGAISLNSGNGAARVNLGDNQGGGNATVVATQSANLTGTQNVLVESTNNISMRIQDQPNSHNNFSLNKTSVTLNCGDPTAGQSSLTMNGSDKNIILAQGPVLGTNTKIKIEENKAEFTSATIQHMIGKVTVEPAKINVSALFNGQGAEIVADEASISMSVGLSKISVNKDSIQLNVGSSSISIDAQGVTIAGVNINQQAQMLAQLETQIHKQMSDAIEQIKATLKTQN